jgi:hypothetical protein
MSSELPLKADVARSSRYVSNVPTTDILNQFDSPVDKPPDGQIATRRREHVPLVSR